MFKYMESVVILRKTSKILLQNIILNFDLLVDEDFQLSKAIGVYQLKKSFGKESMGIVRQHLLLMRMALSSMSLKRLK